MVWASNDVRRVGGAVVLAALFALISVVPGSSASAEPRSPIGDRAGIGQDTLKAKRGGVNPCMTADPGFGIYDRWDRGVAMGQMLAPQRGGLTRGGGFDLIVHFHGHYPVRKEFVKEAEGTVLVALDLGVGSGAYSRAFASRHAFERLLESVKKRMAVRHGRKKTYIRKLGLSAWSAGYGAIAQILEQPAGRDVDALILLDSVHAGYVNPKEKTLKTGQLEPFVDFARKAARGRAFMFQSHSSIIPPGYASTREVSHHIVDAIGGRIRKASRHDVLGLELFERYDRGNYHVRGYRGNDKPDHCAHLGLMADVMQVHINRRWRSPKGYKGKSAVSAERREAAREGRLHTVRRGDTLTEIAAVRDVTVEDLREANGLSHDDPIRIGQELIIPEAGRSGKKKKGGDEDDGPEPEPGEKLHKVYKGQSLGAIARRYHVTVDAIRDRNGLKKGGRPIQPGDELIIPKRGSKAKKRRGKKDDDPKLGPGEKLHEVYKGQTLGAIARRYNVTVDAIRERNDLKKDGRPIQPGDELIIPKRK